MQPCSVHLQNRTAAITAGKTSQWRAVDCFRVSPLFVSPLTQGRHQGAALAPPPAPMTPYLVSKSQGTQRCQEPKSGRFFIISWKRFLTARLPGIDRRCASPIMHREGAVHEHDSGIRSRSVVTPLAAGQRLDQARFHERYEQLPAAGVPGGTILNCSRSVVPSCGATGFSSGSVNSRCVPVSVPKSTAAAVLIKPIVMS